MIINEIAVKVLIYFFIYAYGINKGVEWALFYMHFLRKEGKK